MKKRLLASLLTLCMMASMLPVSALESDETGPENSTPAVCTAQDDCTAETHQADCPKFVACTKTEGCTLADGHEGECVVPDEADDKNDAQTDIDDKTDGQETDPVDEPQDDPTDPEEPAAPTTPTTPAAPTEPVPPTTEPTPVQPTVPAPATTTPPNSPNDDIVPIDAPVTDPTNNAVAKIGDTPYSTLADALNAAKSGDIIKLAANDVQYGQNENGTIAEGAKLVVPSGKTLTVNGLGILKSKGTLVVEAGGTLKLPNSQSTTEEFIGGGSARLNLSNGSIEFDIGAKTLTLTAGSEAAVPNGKTAYLLMGTEQYALDAVIESGATLTVNGELKAISGDQQTGSKVTVKGTLDASAGKLAVAKYAVVNIEKGGVVKAAMPTDASIIGTINVKAGGELSVGTAMIGGSDAVINLTAGSIKADMADISSGKIAINLVGATAEVPANKYWTLKLSNLNTNVSLDNGSKLTISGTEFKVANGSTLTNNGTITVNTKMTVSSEGTVAGSGTIVNKGTLQIEKGSTQSGALGNNVTNSGTVVNNGTDANQITGTITMANGGKVYSQADITGKITGAQALTAEADKKYGETTYAYAWGTASYTVTLSVDTTKGTLPTDTATTVSAANGEVIKLPEVTAKVGYKFTGWKVGDTSSIITDGTYTVTGTVTLTAQFTAVKTYKVSFDPGKGKCNTEEIVANEGDTITLPRARRTGYDFRGWYDGSTRVGFDGDSYKVTKNVTLDAEWRESDTTSSTSGDYSITVKSVKNGKVTVSPKSADRNDTVTITVKPDKGYELDSLVITDKNGDEIDYKVKSTTKYTFKMPKSKVTIKAVFSPVGSKPVVSRLPFVDVASNASYYDAVAYVYRNGMMIGTSANTFDPYANLSRGMIAQIFYNMEGRPAIQGTAFADVKPGAWYTQAVAWAATSGVVVGYPNGTYGPHDTLTREQFIVILYNYAQSKGYRTTARASLSAYSDAGQVSSYADAAMRWAVSEGLISTVGGSALAPQSPATRVQVAEAFMAFGQNVMK